MTPVLGAAMTTFPDLLSVLPSVLQALDQYPSGAHVLVALAGFYFIGRRPK